MNLDRLFVDIRSAVRSLRAAPAIPIGVILTTALAVGITSPWSGSSIAHSSARRPTSSIPILGAAVAATGVFYGTVVAMGAGWAARSLIFGLPTPGPLVVAMTSLLVLVVAMVAAWLPAVSASRGEPDVLLRAE